MRSKAIATGLAIATGIAANAAPAAASTGGVGPDGLPQGGVSAEKTANASSIASKLRIIRHHIETDTPLDFLTLDGSSQCAEGSDADLIATSKTKPGLEIVNPLVIMSADGGRIARLVGRTGETSLAVIPASQADITAFMGNQALEIEDPRDYLAPHTLQPVPFDGTSVAGFTAENGDGFGLMP